MPRPTKPSRYALAAVLITMAPSAANALLLTDDEGLASYAGLATLTVTRSGPTPSATQSGSGAAISGNTTFVMAWTGGGTPYAYPLGSIAGAPLFAIDFGTMLAGRAPVSLGRHVFDLSRDPADLTIDELNLTGPSVGDLAGLLARAEGASDRATWSDSVTQGIFQATYQLLLFDVPDVISISSGTTLVNADFEGSFGGNVAVNAIPEPGLLALLGIGLLGLAISRRSRGR